MNTAVLETNALTKKYKHTTALDHVSLRLEKGEIYGFIGQNGAGKTTLLRLITGLSFPTQGELSLWGKSTPSGLQEQRRRIGCMIETPALYPNLTAAQNLEVQRIQRGIPDKSIIPGCLKTVGLQDTGKKKARNFSLGMRPVSYTHLVFFPASIPSVPASAAVFLWAGFMKTAPSATSFRSMNAGKKTGQK